MFFKSVPSPAVTLKPIVCYMKSSEGKQFDRDLALLDTARAQFQSPFSLVIERDGSEKLGDLLRVLHREQVSTVIIPDFSHLGFSPGDLSSSIADLFTLLMSGVCLISVRDGFDSRKESYRDAVDMLLKNVKELAA